MQKTWFLFLLCSAAAIMTWQFTSKLPLMAVMEVVDAQLAKYDFFYGITYK